MRKHHYAWRGGPKFWSSDSDIKEGSAEYVAALAACVERPKTGAIGVPQMVDRYLDSADFTSRAPRTQADYRKWALRFAAEFCDDPAVLFEDAGSRAEVARWRENWRHSPKQYDYAATVVSVVLNWARDAGIIGQHHCDRMRRIYQSDRSEIVWAPSDVKRFNEVAPDWVRRILTVATETGLSPGDLIRLTWNHVENTPKGRRIKIRRAKTKRIATIPVTPKMSELLNATSKGRALILLSQRGRPLTEHRASEGVRQWRDKAGLSNDLRLEDARGTAATNLLRAECSLGEIAAHMGWSLRHAANVIENYVAVAPELADEILIKLERARRA
jgi:integrase